MNAFSAEPDQKMPLTELPIGSTIIISGQANATEPTYGQAIDYTNCLLVTSPNATSVTLKLTSKITSQFEERMSVDATKAPVWPTYTQGDSLYGDRQLMGSNTMTATCPSNYQLDNGTCKQAQYNEKINLLSNCEFWPNVDSVWA
jgi:hypothetical protein